MQAGATNWLAENLGILIFFVIVLSVLLLALYIRKYVRIFDPNIFYVHLRRGKAIKQGEGGMVVRIPFRDSHGLVRVVRVPADKVDGIVEIVAVGESPPGVSRSR